MATIRRSAIKRWEVSIIRFWDENGHKYKVTRRLPEISVAETKVFKSKKRAKKQFDDWLQ